MDDRDANIDLVFRNGFKDYEVLPPPEIWDNIQPVVGRKRRSPILFRSAAMLAVLLTLGFLANRWSREIPSVSDNQILSVTGKSVPLFENPSTADNFKALENNEVKLNSPESTLSTEVPDISIKPDFETIITPVRSLSPETELLTENNNFRLAGQKSDILSIPKTGISFTKDLTANLFPVTEPLKEVNRWSITAMASPTYFSQLNYGNDALSRQLMASEQPLISYSGGVALAYKINKRISIQSGLYYSSVGQEVDGISTFVGFRPYENTKGTRIFEVLTSSGMIYTNNADVFLMDPTGDRVISQNTNDVFDPGKANLQYLNNSLKQNFSYLELPVILRYKLIDRSLDLNLIGGLSYNFLVNNSVYTINDGKRYPIGKTEGLSIMTFSSSLGMGMEYDFTKNISLNLEPTFRYYLNPFNNLEGVNIHPYSFGIFSGISFRF